MQTSDTESICPYCGKDLVITDGSIGERFCQGCGFVICERGEYTGSEWRAFSKEEYDDKSRTGSPISLAVHDMGLATVIGHENTDASGRPLSFLMKSRMNHLRTWDRRSQVHESLDRNLRQAFAELDKLRDKLALSDAVKEKAAYIYRKAIISEAVRGRSIAGIVAATLYAACRDSETPRTLAEVANGINIGRKEVSRCYRLLLLGLGLTMPVADPIKCVSRIANNCNLNEKIKRGALAILNDAAKMELSAGKDPMGLAAAALYLSCVMSGNETTQKVIAPAAGVTEVTIRNRFKGLRESLSIAAGN
ncbi:MAG: transcription initiation factor IIB [Thaumarchaeota archaeon]|nr:transcription initiation factor IIB [Nitrososphaerota archaeon]